MSASAPCVYCGVYNSKHSPDCPNYNPPLPILSGHWRQSEGMLFCGTLRIAKADFDTNPTETFQEKVFQWI